MADEPWQVLAELVRLRREERHLSQRQLGTAAGTTDRLISDIERAVRTNFEPATLRAVSRALGWTAESIAEILAGGNPTPAEAAADTSAETSSAAGSAWVRDQLADMQRQIDELKARLEGGASSQSKPA